MNRQRTWKRLALAFFLVATIPLLALLCRGRTPNRFATYNLPPWELQLVGEPTRPTVLDQHPLSPANIHFVHSAAQNALLRQDENALFANLDAHAGAIDNPAQAGAPGQWLRQAIVYTGDRRMRAKIERVCARLMDAQNPLGYLGAPTGSSRYPSAYLIGHCENMRGLLVAYGVLKEPALIFACLRAGSFLLQNFDPDLIGDAPAKGEVSCSLAMLYDVTGDRKALDFASAAARRRDAATTEGGGVAMCALYEMTGRKEYLASALMSRIWDDSPELAAELFKITGNRDYLTEAAKGRGDDPFLDSVAVTRAGNTLVLNEWRSCVVAAGRARVVITPTDAGGSITFTGVTDQITAVKLPGAPHADLIVERPEAPTYAVASANGGSWKLAERWQKGTKLVVQSDARLSGAAAAARLSNTKRAGSATSAGRPLS